MTTKRWWIGSGLVACLWAGSVPVEAQDQESPPINNVSPQSEEVADEFRLQVEVPLVNVTATILGPSGEYVEGLTAADFTIFEDGIEQQISFFSHDRSVPISLGILVDVSGSMQHKLQQSLQTAREVAMALSPEDEVFIVTYAEDSNVLTDFTETGSHIQQIFRGIRTGGDTHQFDAIGLALRMMENAKHQKKVLLLLTDGFDTQSRLTIEEVDDLLKQAEVLVYAIGIDDDDTDPEVRRRTRYHVYHYMLARLTDVTGGRAFRIYTGRRYALQSLAEILLEELHQQYTLSYYPTSGSFETSWREIRLRLENPDATVRHRTGYYSGGGLSVE
jgi:Ca-activated chloride channel family protein